MNRDGVRRCERVRWGISLVAVLRLQRTLTSLTSRLPRSRPYLATTGRNTSVTGLVGFALSPTDRLIGTRSSLRVEQRNIHKRASSGFTTTPQQNRTPVMQLCLGRSSPLRVEGGL